MTETHDFAYDHDGLILTGQIARPSSAEPHPGVLVMHSALGLDDLVCRRARDLAALGYVALATDMYGVGQKRISKEECGPLFLALQESPDLLRSRATAGFDRLRALPEVDAARISAIGFCFGGQCALELARNGADLRSVVSFHGLLRTALPAQPRAVKAKVLTISGARDPYVPAEDVAAFREEMTNAAADWQVTVYGQGLHALPSRISPSRTCQAPNTIHFSTGSPGRRQLHSLRRLWRPDRLLDHGLYPCSEMYCATV